MIIIANPILNAYNDISLAVNARITKYMDVDRHRGMMENEYTTVGSYTYLKK